jgi:hypothetical protein
MDQSAIRSDCAKFGLLAPLLLACDAWLLIGVAIRTLL